MPSATISRKSLFDLDNWLCGNKEAIPNCVYDGTNPCIYSSLELPPNSFNL